MSDRAKPAAKRRRLDLHEEVVVFIGTGEKQKKFTVPKTYLTKSSEFFQKCCNGQWRESSTNTVSLSETDANLFSTYLQFLYSGELVANDKLELLDGKPDDEDLRHEISSATFKVLVGLAILADLLMDVTFANAIVDESIKAQDTLRQILAPDEAARLYANTLGASNIKRLIVDWYASMVELSYFKEHRTLFHTDMVFDVMLRLQERVGDDNLRPTWQRRCDYHEHNEKVPKCV